MVSCYTKRASQPSRVTRWKIITLFSRLVWSIFNPWSWGIPPVGGGWLTCYLRNTKMRPFFLWMASESNDWHATDGPHYDKTSASAAQTRPPADLLLSSSAPIKYCDKTSPPSCSSMSENKEEVVILTGEDGQMKWEEPLNPNRLCVFIGPWINVAFLVEKGSAVMKSEYLSLPPGAGLQWQGRSW